MNLNHTLTLGTLLLALSSPAAAQVAPEPFEQCVVQIGNRTTPVDEFGDWTIDDVRAIVEPTRARLFCQDAVGKPTRSGQSEPFVVSVGQTSGVAPIPFGNLESTPTRIEIAAPSASLEGAGATAQLTVTGTYGDGSTKDVSAAATGTHYTSTNPGIVSVTVDGFVSAQASGLALIVSTHEGVTATVILQVTVGGDTDGDGLPDDYELLVGLNPDDPIDALADHDGDGLNALEEYAAGTHPFQADSDGDGLSDGEEVVSGTDGYVTNPALADTDGDLVFDGEEVAVGTDPTDALDYDLAAVVVSLKVQPGFVVMLQNPILPAAVAELAVIGVSITGRGIDLTHHGDTVYTDMEPGVVLLGLGAGDLEAIAPGATTIRVTAAGEIVNVPVEVRASGPRPLSTLEFDCPGNAVSLTDALIVIACGDAGLVLVDRGQPATPAVLATVATPETAWDVEVQDDVAWIAMGSAGVGRVALDDTANVQLDETIDVGGQVMTLSVDGGRLVAGTADSNMHVIEISGEVPAVLGAVSLPGVAREVDLVGDVALAALGPAGLAVVNAATLELVSSVDAWDEFEISASFENDGYIRDVIYAPPYAYLAAHYQGLSVVDLSILSSPVVLSTSTASAGAVGPQFMLEDLALAGGLMFGADIVRVNEVPIFSLLPPATPLMQELIDFSVASGDGEGTSIAADEVLVVVMTRENVTQTAKVAVGASRLQIGQWNGIDDTGGLAPVCGLVMPTSPVGVFQGSSFPVLVSAIDDVMVDAVTIQWIDQSLIVDTMAPFTATLTAPLTPGLYPLTIEALDLAGNVGQCDLVIVSVMADDTCQLGPDNCDDLNFCTVDTCEEGVGCVFEMDCDDGDPCTEDTCPLGLGCQHPSAGCDDGLACTEETCDPVLGCTFPPVTCDDGTVCTTESCSEEAGGCTTTGLLDCDDGDLCTEPYCSPTDGCTQPAVNCDDLNPCTTSSCDSATGCESAAVLDGTACGDNGVCASGSCVGQDANVFGFVATAGGLPVSNAVVTVTPGGAPVLSDVRGYFETFSSDAEAVVQISAAGHSTAYLTVSPSAGTTLMATVKPLCGIFELDLSEGAPPADPVGCGGVTLTQVEGPLLLPDGGAWAGTVLVEIASVQAMWTQTTLYSEATEGHAMVAHLDAGVVPRDLRQDGAALHLYDMDAGFEVRLRTLPPDGLSEPLRLSGAGALHLEHTVWTAAAGSFLWGEIPSCSKSYASYDEETGLWAESVTGDGAYASTAGGFQWMDHHKCTVSLVVSQSGWFTTPAILNVTSGVGYCATGKVVDEAGDGVPGATVVVDQQVDPVTGWGHTHRQPRVAVTAADGTYSYQYSYLTDPQIQALSVDEDGQLSRSAAVTYDPAAADLGECVEQADLVLNRGCVQGTLQDALGAPVADATVASGEGAQTLTGADGSFCLPASSGLDVILTLGEGVGFGYVAQRVEVAAGSAQCGAEAGCTQLPPWQPESSFTCLRGQVNSGWGEPWAFGDLDNAGTVEVYPSSVPGGAPLSSSAIEPNGEFCVDLLNPGQSVALFAYVTQAQSRAPEDYVTWHSCAPVCGSTPWLNTPTFPEITVPSTPGDCSSCPNVLPTIPCGGDLTYSTPEDPSTLCEDVCGCGEACGSCAVELDTCLDKCGTDNFEGQCSCKPDCVQKGTCCDDFCAGACGDTYPMECGTCPECQVGSCALLCGTPSNAGGCFCDEGCFNRGDCCQDVCTTCDSLYSGTGECDLCEGCTAGSCDNACNMGEFSLGCSCGYSTNEDGEWETCFATGACCDDICDTCGASNFAPECAATEGTCGGRCPDDPQFWDASKYIEWASCQCDSLCFFRGDCCADICEQCPTGYEQKCHTCEGCSPGSCANLCGVETTGWTGCSCDLECVDDDPWLCGAICDDLCESCGAEQYAECACDGCTKDSCAGRCGVTVSDGCGCDPSCIEDGTCCDDFCPECSAENPQECGTCDGCSPDSCVERCGVQGASGCACDTDCWAREDCCTDICEPCELENLQCGTCEDRCGQYTYPYIEPDLGICSCDGEQSYFWGCVDMCEVCPEECAEPDPGPGDGL